MRVLEAALDRRPARAVQRDEGGGAAVARIVRQALERLDRDVRRGDVVELEQHVDVATARRERHGRLAGPVAQREQRREIDHGRRPLHISDGRGVRLLALLLARPGEQIHSLDLVAAVDGMSPAPPGAARAVGIGDRESGSQAERARVNVTRAIRSALKRIAGHDAELGAELEAAVRTGALCAYDPDPRRPRRWRVE